MKLKLQNKHIAFLLIGIALSSCVKEIEYKGSEGDPLLVVNEIIEKDSTFKFEIGRSRFFLDDSNGDNALSNVQVTLKNTTASTEETLSSGPSGEYHFNMVAQEGHTYVVTASHPDYPSVSATTTIPVTVPLISVDTNSVQESPESRVMHSKLKWNDPAGDNYYLVYCREMNAFGTNRLDLTSKDIDITNVQADFETGEKFAYFFALDDVGFDGGQKTLDIEFYLPPSGADPYQLKYVLLSCTEDAYKYIISADLNSNTGNDPFTEPVRVRNNIENGLGIFAGINEAVIIK